MAHSSLVILFILFPLVIYILDLHMLVDHILLKDPRNEAPPLLEEIMFVKQIATPTLYQIADVQEIQLIPDRPSTTLRIGV